MKWFKRALALRPDEVRLLHALGNTLVQTENISEVKDVYQRPFQLDHYQSDVELILKKNGQLEGSLKQRWQTNCTYPYSQP